MRTRSTRIRVYTISAVFTLEAYPKIMLLFSYIVMAGWWLFIQWVFCSPACEKVVMVVIWVEL